MNMADEVSGDDDSSSSDENEVGGGSKSSGPFDPSNTTNKLAVPNPQSENKCDTSMSSSHGLQSKLLPDGQTTPVGSIKSSDN